MSETLAPTTELVSVAPLKLKVAGVDGCGMVKPFSTKDSPFSVSER